MIKRDIQKIIEQYFFKGKIIIIYGARQVGKTTLVRAVEDKYSKESIYFNCDEPDIRDKFTNVTSTQLEMLVRAYNIIIIDEAQRIKNVGLTLKLLIDNFPEKQIIATGSSAFELSNLISEPLTGRKFTFQLFPFSLMELQQKYSLLEINRLLENRIIYGMYPDIVKHPENPEFLLKELINSYLFKDILQYHNIKHPELLEKLLAALALQIGNQVSYNELAGLINISKETVASYIQLLEKSYVIFRLSSFSRNIRNELKRSKKIYFVDTGLRNALIRNYNPLYLRQDTGALWENFIISERLKYNQANMQFPNTYFWRTHQQQEIDYIEEIGGKLYAYEFKWQAKKKGKIPKVFINAYPDSETKTVNIENYMEFILT
ncbi:MAG: ATP-binding protein [Bacteroidales bacterium]|nr:ATP-binding protein [Bacteroidales bacterium]